MAEEHITISSLVIETNASETESVADALAQLDGVEVHGQEPGKIVITIEKESIAEAHDLANSFSSIPGVINVDLIYFNFEDDVELQAKFDKLHKQENEAE